MYLHGSDLRSSQRHVSYSCGACGYALNLCSSHRNTEEIDSKYSTALKKGLISFMSVDESRFTQVDQLTCLPYFIAKHSRGLLRPRTKLLCRKCGNFIGYAYEETVVNPVTFDNSDSGSSSGVPTYRKYNIRIWALQPSLDDSRARMNWTEEEWNNVCLVYKFVLAALCFLHVLCTF